MDDSATEIDSSVTEPLLESLRQESDRGCVLVSAAFIDQALRHAIEASFSPGTPGQAEAVQSLLSSRGPLGRMWARLQYARARDIIDEEVFKATECVRGIRNRFAHGYERVAFDDTLVQKPIATLREYAVRWSTGEPSAAIVATAIATPVGGQDDRRRISRAVFELSVMYIVGRLHGYAGFVRRRG